MKCLKLSALILAVVMLTPILPSCSETTNDDETEETIGTQVIKETTETEPDNGIVAPDVTYFDLEGEIFNILGANWGGYEPLNITDIIADTVTGEALNDATYNRATFIGETFNTKLVFLNFDYPTIASMLTQAINSGDDVYNAVITRTEGYANLISGELIQSLDNYSYFNFEDPWFSKESLEGLAVLGEHYAIVSDITMNQYLNVFSSYINLEMMEDYQLGSIYDIIREGSWNIDLLNTWAAAVSMDTDADGLYTPKDRYGMTYVVDAPEGLFNAAGLRYGELDTEGHLVITYDTDTSISAMQKIMSILSQTQYYFNCHTRSSQPAIDEVGMFASGEVLCSMGGIYYAPQYREMEDNFAIVPMPKIYVEQENYYSPMLSNIVPILVLPVTNLEYESSGAILTELAYLGKRDLYPALYEDLLQGKIARDANSAEMLDLIFSNTFFDPGVIYFSSARSAIRTLYANLIDAFSSTMARTRTMTEKLIKNLENDFEELIESQT